MMGKVNILMMSILAVLIIAQDSSPAALSSRTKPQPPVQISITPVQSGSTSSKIQPGDAVDLNVTVISSTDASMMRVLSTLGGGVELIAGDLSWSGEVRKGQEIIVPLIVRAPMKGKGKIITRVEIFSGDTLLYSSKAVYELVTPEKQKPQQPRAIRKDSKGQGVAEYH